MAPVERDRKWWILGVLCLTLLTTVLDNTILNVAVPTLIEDLDASTADVQWVINAYSLALAGFLIASGGMADHFGRKRALFAGLTLFGVGSLTGALASSVGTLVTARVVMGLGASLLMPATLAVLMHVFGDEERMKAIGIWMAVSAAGMAGGPVIGGFLLAHFWWGSVFLINVPIAAIGLVAIVWLVPESRNPHSERPDFAGLPLSVLGMVALVWTVIAVPEHGWADVLVLGPLAVAVAALALFAWWERRAPHPMLDMGLFTDRRFTGAALGGLLAAFGMGGSLFLLTQQLQFVLGYTPLQTGVRIVPFAVALLIGSGAVSAPLGKKIGLARTVALSMVVAALGLCGIAATSDSGYGWTLPGLVVVGFAMGTAGPAAGAALMSAIPPSRAGTASGVNGTLQELGTGLGVAALGAALVSRFDAGLPGSLPAGAEKSLPTALALAGDRVQETRDAFVSAMETSQFLGALAVAVGGVAAGALLGWAGREPAAPAMPVGAVVSVDPQGPDRQSPV
ncbi:DHA2 family efflux MFS transporter permease subunit [Streptomyces sp. NPDC087294]|uniref:DHA2 family efflux MFS transporter permease subunit n=1 Tax=Streptomyces sp. NPDC087294 TaxID=3365777 RepID=UPI003819244C